ncbi:MAG: fasciclin domain-containing protein [Rhizomicrobium sp.]
MKRMMIAGFAGGAAMMIGGALGAVSNSHYSAQPKPIVDAAGGVMNPMIGGQAMLANRNLLENISASPDHTTLVAAMRESGVADALTGNGLFTVFAPTNAALSTLPARALEQNKTQLARMMGYLVVPGKYDSQALLRVIGEGGGQAKLRTVEGGVLVARMNGPTNVILMDEKGGTADIAIYDIYDKNGVMHVVDHMLEPGMTTRQVADR